MPTPATEARQGSPNYFAARERGLIEGEGTYADSEPHHRRLGGDGDGEAVWAYVSMHSPAQEEARAALHEGRACRLREWVVQRCPAGADPLDERNWAASYIRCLGDVRDEVPIPADVSISVSSTIEREDDGFIVIEGAARIERCDALVP